LSVLENICHRLTAFGINRATCQAGIRQMPAEREGCRFVQEMAPFRSRMESSHGTLSAAAFETIGSAAGVRIIRASQVIVSVTRPIVMVETGFSYLRISALTSTVPNSTSSNNTGFGLRCLRGSYASRTVIAGAAALPETTAIQVLKASARP
jgi:hypothetical protein